jgi:hypothetical protein
MAEGYNGWSNYETWLLNLWYGDYLQDIANEEGSLEADQIETIIEEIMAEDLPETGFSADILNAALRRVNWHELAKHYTDDISPEGLVND